MAFNTKKFFWGFAAGILGAVLLIVAGGGVTFWYLTSTMESAMEAPVQAPKIELAAFKNLNLVPAGGNNVEPLDLKADKVYVISFFDPGSKNDLIQLPGLGDLQEKVDKKKTAFYFIGESTMKKIKRVSEKFEGKLPIYQLQDSLPEIFNYTLPKTYIIAKNQIVFEHEGAANWNDSTVVNFINRQL